MAPWRYSVKTPQRETPRQRRKSPNAAGNKLDQAKLREVATKLTSTPVTATPKKEDLKVAAKTPREGKKSHESKELKQQGRISDKMMQFMLLFSRQGKLRLQKWYTAYQDK
ncbi:hypothetical protein TELCIR_18770, partial [Teladorsagia circumcincta]